MTIDVGSLHFAVGPVIALVVIVLLGLLLRWIFGSGRTRAVPPPPSPDGGDHGLLRPVTTVPDRPRGNAVRAVLSDAGIRSTISARRDGTVQVLVFADDVERARRLVPPAG